MYFNLQLTLNCNLNCSYCLAQETSSPMPKKITYELDTLQRFIEKDPNPHILFYGGEPLLELPLMLKIMESIKAKSFVLQTNGLLMHKIPTKFLNKFENILVSIDGNKNITDYYRGKNTYDKIIDNIKNIKERGYKNELVARMTVSEESNIYEDVNYLLNLKDPAFDSIHWQLDMMFNDRELWNNIEKWISEYNIGVNLLIDEWIHRMSNEKKVSIIYPFIAIMKSLLLNEPSKLRCGCGWIWQNINTDGSISACPVASEFEMFQFGHIKTTNPIDTRDALLVKEPCIKCDIFDICGGRCLYSNYLKPWGLEDFKLSCYTTRNLIEKLKEKKKQVQDLIINGTLKIEQFNYSEFNGCEIIP